MNPARHVVAGAAGLLLLAAAAGLVTRDDGDPSAPSTPGQIAIAGFAFAPETTTVSVGDTLTWTNEDSTDHTVDSNGQGLDSESIGQGEAFEHTFEEPGTFSYFCAFHPFMKGTVEVTG